MKHTMILLATLLTAFSAAANVDDDTIKVSRVMLGGQVSKVSISGYANVSIVDDTISYLTSDKNFIGCATLWRGTIIFWDMSIFVA